MHGTLPWKEDWVINDKFLEIAMSFQKYFSSLLKSQTVKPRKFLLRTITEVHTYRIAQFFRGVIIS